MPTKGSGVGEDHQKWKEIKNQRIKGTKIGSK
jgi:hypothetical protein